MLITITQNSITYNYPTSLKSLKFGHDKNDGGSSNQPYIQTSINESRDKGLLNNFLLEYGILTEAQASSFDFKNDFVLRGGGKAITNSTTDVERLGKYFSDIKNPSGLLFVAKQNLLSRTAVQTQASGRFFNEGIYTPLSTLAQAGGNAFGLHVNKQGLNPFGGILSSGSSTPSQYEDAVKLTNTDLTNIGSINRLVGLWDKQIISSSESSSVLTYPGGPGSILGIGNTHIKFATGNGVNNVRTGINNSAAKNLLTFFGTYSGSIKTSVSPNDQTLKQQSKPSIIDFRKKLNDSARKITTYGDPGYKSPTEPFSGSYSNSSYDKVTASDMYKNTDVKTDDEYLDLVNFRIGVVDNDVPTKKTYIHFRAFLDQISDSYSADWKDTHYVGRAEKFYNYTGFDRKISLSWTVAAQSKAELMPMYQKLNFLASVCAPDYSPGGYMRGNIVTLTIGDYINEQYGIITGFSYEMNADTATWEVGIGEDGMFETGSRQLPHLIKVNGFNFIPIHSFAPQLQKNTPNSTTNIISSFGKEQYIMKDLPAKP